MNMAERRRVVLSVRPERWGLGTSVLRSGPLVFLGVGAVYLALSQFVLWLNDPVNAGAGLWPAAGLTLAALLLLPTALWPWVLGAVLAAELGGDLAVGYSLPASLGWTAGNVVEPLVGATLMRWAGNPHGALTPLRPLTKFLALAVVAGPLVGASIGSVTTVLAVGGTLLDVWPKYLLGDALGVLVVAPVLLAWRDPRPRRSRWEACALWLCALVVTGVVFSALGGSWTATMAYVLVPFFTWAALRYGVRDLSLLCLVVAFLANSLTASGGGAFSTAGGPDDHAVPLLQVFLVVAVSSALILTALVSELSDRRQVEQELRHQASHDPLTGLPNRAVLSQTLDLVIGRRAEVGAGVALLMCDVDHFKAVNDTYGHAVGDALLVEVAQRLRSSVRADDVVARISGDEFVILLRDADAAAVGTVCERLMSNVGAPLPVADHGALSAVTPSLSVGVARSGTASSAASLLRGADAALYEAKRQGRGRVVHVDDDLRMRARERADLERDFPAAVARQVLSLHQPVVELRTGRLAGLESVAQWQHPDRGLLDSERFLPAVEAIGRTGELFATVLDQALTAQRQWHDLHGCAPAVAVNVTAAELTGASVAELVSSALDRHGARADGLWLEVSERTPLGDAASSALAALRELGVHLAIDDYGTGWSSLHRLCAHCWELVKIDRSFVAALGEDRAVDAVIAATVAMAHQLGIRTVATGVQTTAQLERLVEIGCDLAQGDVLSPPVPAAAAAGLMDPHGRWIEPLPEVPSQAARSRRRAVPEPRTAHSSP